MAMLAPLEGRQDLGYFLVSSNKDEVSWVLYHMIVEKFGRI
jgi:hypothetical protein